MANYLEGDELFWERLEEMSEGEALDELQKCRTLAVQRKVWLISTGNPHLMKELHGIDLLLIKLKEAIRIMNTRTEKIRWAQAVRTLYGDEGFTACLEWMRAEEHSLPPRGKL